MKRSEMIAIIEGTLDTVPSIDLSACGPVGEIVLAALEKAGMLPPERKLGSADIASLTYLGASHTLMWHQWEKE